VEAVTRQAVEAVRLGDGPRLLEARTYRFRAHSIYDAELYRSKEEVEQWKKRDPITTFTVRLREQNLSDDKDLAALEAEVAEEVAEAVIFAESGPWEPVENLLNDVYTPVT
jgi:pyruvate dehydrogenase E1 component alpha subunit